MADDAGAVRRTPRPARIPALWWSPAECSVYADREGAAPHYLQMRDTRLFALPDDAVQLAGPERRDELEQRRTELAAVEDALHGLDSDLGDDAPLGARVQELHESYLDMTRCHSEEVERTQKLTRERDQARADTQEWQRVAEERNGTARVMADLRDQVTAAQSEKDTTRSDAEEFRSERDDLAGQLEDMTESRTKVMALLRKAQLEANDLRGEITEARTYVAQHNHPVDPEWSLHDVLVAFVEHLKCERDGLQARIEEIRAELDAHAGRISNIYDGPGLTVDGDAEHQEIVGTLGRIREIVRAGAALQGDQPTGEADRG